MATCRNTILTLLCILCGLGTNSYAEERPKVRLGLDSCISLAIHYNPEYRRQQVQHRQVQLQEENRRNAFLPTVQASISNGWDFGRSADKTGVMSDRSSLSLSGSIGASMALFTGFSRLHELKSAKLQTEASSLGLLQAEQDLGMQITQLYFAVLHARRVLSSAQRQYVRNEEQLDYARSMHSAGRWGLDRVAEAEAVVAQSALNLTQAESNIELAMLDIEQAIGVSGIELEDLPIEESIIQAKQEQLAGNSYVEYALVHRPALRANTLGQDALREEIKAQRAGYIPHLNLSLGYSNSYYRVLGMEYDGFNLPFSDQINQNGRSYISLGLSIPIFDAFRTRTQIRNSKLSLLSLQAERLSLETKLRREIETAVLNMNLAERNIDATERSLKASTTALSLVEASWRAGRTTSDALSQASSRAFVAEVDHLNAQARYVLQAYLLRFYLNR